MLDRLSSPSDQALLVEFLESIDVTTVPFVTLSVRRQGNQVFIAFDSIVGVDYNIVAKNSLSDSWSGIAANALGTGGRMEVPLNIGRAMRFFALTQGL